MAAGVAAGYSAWWLLAPGELPDQLVRASAVLTTAVFVGMTLRTRVPFTHRGLLAIAAAAAGTGALMVALGSSWGELRWWVAHRTGLAARSLIGRLWSVAPPETGGAATQTPQPTLEQLEALFQGVVRFLADFFPAVTGLELLVGLTLAAAIYYRIARRPRGVPPQRLRHFRFSEHFGWAVAVPLVVLLVPALAAAKAAAANVLLITGTLYILRGAAVAAFGLHMLGGGGALLTVLIAVAVVVLLPLVLGGAMVLGVLDAGLDLRRRWATPPASE